MVARAVARSPERVAWTVLLSSFFVLVSLVAIVLVGGRWWLRTAMVSQGINIVPSGTVLVTRPGRGAPEVNLTDIPVGSVIRSEPNAQASLTFMAADGEILATVRIFGATIMEIVEAESPRFSTGISPHRVTLHVTSGRVRANVAVDARRPVRIDIRSDPAAVTVLDTPGSNVSVEAGPTETIVTVREGQAVVDAEGGSVILGRDQRTEVLPQAAPNGPLPAEQNWIKNGDFALPLDGIWHVAATDPEADEMQGEAIITANGGRHVLQLTRTGSQWARVGATQDINRDVQGLTSLRLNADIFISAQDVRNCGAQGTECPLMVKIIYVDVGGGTQEWLQGFYWFLDPGAGLTYCGTCAVRFTHILWRWATWQTYASDNLLQVFAANGTPAASIKSVTIYSEGHSYNSLVTDVQLLASE
jgi:hypothetical protein